MHMHTITPLPLRLEPQPWEELASFLARTARHMQYAHTSWLLQPELAKQRMTSRNLSLLAAQDDYTFLSDLLALSEEQIYRMTIHPLDVLSRHLLCFPPFQRGAQKPSPPTISNGTPINRPTLSRQVYQFSCLTSGITQICTLCLQEPVPYDRLYWKTKYLITCPEHRLLLQRRCSRCHSPILSTRLNPLICHLCQQPYQNTSLAIPEEASFLCQGDLLTLHALGVAPHHSADRGAHAHDRRQLLPDAQYLALMRALSLSMRPLQTADFQAFLPSPVVTLLTQSQSRPFTPQERLPPLHMATIHWLFAQWPKHFFTFETLRTAHARHRKKRALSFFSLPSTFRTLAPHAYQILSSP